MHMSLASYFMQTAKKYTRLDKKTEKSVYDATVDRAKLSTVTHFSCDGQFTPPPPGARRPSNSTPIEAHYSFDMAWPVYYPYDPLHPTCMDSLMPRKCNIFGVCCEAIPRQVNYLIDEAVDMGKGSNSIVSMLHHYFTYHGLGEKIVHLHADNCSGQNKNSTMVNYLAWRVMIGQHEQITLSFTIPGTSFRLDEYFCLWRNHYKQTKVGGLEDFTDVVNQSADVNIAQPTGSTNGDVIVPTYNWRDLFLPHFDKIVRIQKLRHLCFRSSSPGYVFVKGKAGFQQI